MMAGTAPVGAVHGRDRARRALLRFCQDTHELAVLRAFSLKLDVAVFLGKQRVITADANINARMKACTALAHEDVASQYFLAAIPLDAESFGF